MADAKPLDYGQRPKRDLSVTRRDISGAFFVLIAIPPGLLGLALIVGGILEPMTHIPQSDRMPGWTQAVIVGIGIVSKLLCLGAALAAIRRLRKWK